MLQSWAVPTDALIGSDYLSLLLNILGGILFILIWQNNLLARRTLLAGIRKYSFARNACSYSGIAYSTKYVEQSDRKGDK